MTELVDYPVIVESDEEVDDVGESVDVAVLVAEVELVFAERVVDVFVKSHLSAIFYFFAEAGTVVEMLERSIDGLIVFCF